MFFLYHIYLNRERERGRFSFPLFMPNNLQCVFACLLLLCCCGSYVVTVFHPPPQSLLPSCGDWYLDDDGYDIGVNAGWWWVWYRCECCLLVTMLVLVFVFKYLSSSLWNEQEQNFCCCYSVMDRCCNTMLLLKKGCCL